MRQRFDAAEGSARSGHSEVCDLSSTAITSLHAYSGSPQVTLLPARRQTQLQRATSEETTWNLVLQGSGRIRLYDSKQSVLLHWDPFTGYCKVCNPQLTYTNSLFVKANAFNLEATNLARLAHGSEASLGTGDLILIPAGYASQVNNFLFHAARANQPCTVASRRTKDDFAYMDCLLVKTVINKANLFFIDVAYKIVINHKGAG